MRRRQPPHWMERLLEWALPGGLSGQATLGDLAEEFHRRTDRSALAARLWYAWQTLSLVLYRVFTGDGVGRPLDSDILMDVRWSLRTLLRRPGFSLGVVLVLALGLGANTGVYSVVDGTLRNTSWWAEADDAVTIWPGQKFSFGQLDLYRSEQSVYRSLGGYTELAFALRTPDGASHSVNGTLITPALFRELAVQPVVGRTLTDEDALFGTQGVVVMGEGIWRRAYGGDPSVVGSVIDVSGAPMTVAGIQAEAGKAPGGRSELWIPLVMDPRDDDFWKAQNLTLVGILDQGRSLDDAAESLTTFTDRLSQLFPMFYPPGFADGRATVERADAAQRRQVATPLLLLLGGTALLLLVTALNVGNLLLGRAIQRRQELALRAALGAGRGRIVSQLLVEGTLLSVLALALGLSGGSLAGRWVAGLFVGEAVVASSPMSSPSVLLFSLGVAFLAWTVLNGVPVLHFLRSQRGGLRVVPDSGTFMRKSLVTAQAALATLLLVSATLLVATVDNLRSVPLGFDTTGLTAVELSPPEDRMADVARARTLYDALIERATAVSGVEAVGLTGWLPLRAQAPSTPLNLETNPVEPAQALKAPMHMVDPGFFQAMGIQAIEGRLLDMRERAGSPSAVVVNETLAATLWPGGSAVGQRIAIDPHAWNRWVRVVGVVPDVRSGGITESTGPALYVALAESPARDVTLVVRSSQGRPSLIPGLRNAVQEADPMVPVRAVMGMEDVVRSAYATSWVMMGLLLGLAVLATGLGAIGVYAVLTHHVVAGRRELGVRMALGARPNALAGSVVRAGLTLAGLGVLLGSVAAVMATRFLESLLFQVSTLAPWAFLWPALALGLAAVLAAWIPASRAGRLPPAEVLRAE